MDFQTLMQYAPIPNILEFKRVLFVGPHPDDIEISSGALVKKLIDNQVEVHFLIVTDGGSGSMDANNSIEKLVAKRKQESFDAGNFLKVNSVEVLDFPDGGVYSIEEMAVAIALRIQKIFPDAVFTCDPLLPTETHPDHLNCGKSTTQAVNIAQYRFSSIRHGIDIKINQVLPKGINLVYYYTHRPNVIIPVSQEDFAIKIQAILMHESQIDESFEAIKMYLYYKATSLGKEINSEFAEGYYAMSPLHQHCFLEKI